MKKLINKVMWYFGYFPLSEVKIPTMKIDYEIEKWNPIKLQAQCEVSPYEVAHAKNTGELSQHIKSKLREQIIYQLWPFEKWEEIDNFDGSTRYSLSLWTLNRIEK